MPTVVLDASLQSSVEALFAGTPGDGLPTIGIELELIPYRIDTYGVAHVSQMRGVLASLPVSFEPGGQVELNPPPAQTVAAAIAQLSRLHDEVGRRLGSIGVGVAAVGLNPWHDEDEVGLQLTSQRYIDMDAHFTRIGSAGRTFMRRTASTQICIGLASGERGMSQWRTANLIAPVLAAMFSNTVVPGARTAVCRAADPARSGHGDAAMTVDEYVSLAAWAEPLGDAFREDVNQHLSTLFPPVRPRGTYLEFRALDALPLPAVRVATSLLACLLGYPPCIDAVSHLLHGVDQRELWDHAAGAGVRVPAVRDLAKRLVDLASATIDDVPRGYLPTSTPGDLEALAKSVELAIGANGRNGSYPATERRAPDGTARRAPLALLVA